MSATVDTRVVQIQFDNKQFEQNVQQTIDSLERLNKALEGGNAGKGAQSIADNLNKADFSGVANGVDNISNRFSAMGIVGMTVIQRLTNAGIDMAMKIGNGVKAAANQIKQGGFVRAENIEQAKFLLAGLKADVDGIMEDVNYAVEGTSYGLDEAARASASFFASGVKQGDEMKQSLRAVAGVAAMTGSDYASMADIFTTVAGQGKVMTQQLRMMENRGLNAAATLRDYFNGVNDGSIEASDGVKQAVKELTGGSKISEEAVRDFVTNGKINFDLFSAAMDNAFGAHAQKANETFSGSLANMKTALSRLGEAFITPSMEAAIPVFNAARGAISSFTTELKTNAGTVNQFSGIINYLGTEVSRFINNLTHMGAFKTLAQTVQQVFRIILVAFFSVKDAFKEVFPEATIANIVKGFNNLLNSMKKIREAAEKPGGMETFKNVMVVLFSAIKIGINILSIAFKIIKTGISLIATPLATITKGLANFSNALANVGSGKEFTIFSKVASTTANIVKSAFKAIIDVFDGIKNGIKGGIDEIHSFQDALAIVGAILAAGWINNKFLFFLTDLHKNLVAILDPKKGITGAFGELTKMPSKINSVFGSLTANMNTMTRNVKADSIQKIAVAVLVLAVALKILSSIDAPGLAKSLSAVTVMLFEMTVVLDVLMKNLGDSNFSKSLKNIYALGSVTNALIKIGVAMILMAAALKIISSLDPKELATGLIGLTVMLGAVLGFVIVIDKYGSSDKKLAGVAITLIGISTAMLILSQSVKQLSELNIGELAKGLGSVVILLGAIMGFIIGVSKLSSGGSAGMIAAGVGMIAIAAALNILVPVLQKLGSMNLIQLAQGMAAIVVAMGAMAGVSQFMSAGGAAGMLIMAISLSVLAGAIERLGNMDIKSLAIGLGTLVVAIAAFAGLSMLLSAAIVPMLGIAAAMLVLSTAIAVLGAGLVMIGAGLAGIAAGIMSFSSVSQTAVLMFANTIQTLIVAIISMLPQVMVALAESFVVFLEQIAELAPRFREAMGTIITSLLGAIEDNIPKIIHTGVTIILNFLDGIEEALPGVVDKGVKIITTFMDEIGKHSEELAKAGGDLVIDLINGIAEGIDGQGEALRKAMMNLGQSMLDEFKGFFGINSPSTVMEEMGGFLMQGLLNGVNSVSGIGTAISEAIRSGVKSIGKFTSNFKTKGGELIKGTAQGIKNKGRDVKTRAGDATKKAWSKVGDYASKFKLSGSNLIKGVAQGIKNGASHAINAATEVARRTWEKFKKKLKINSPSKLFSETAESIPEGVAYGIRKAAYMSEKAAENLADKTLAPVSEAILKAEELMDFSGDLSPTITPVLDLSEVEKSASGISSIFGDNTVSLAASAGLNVQSQNNNFLMSQLIDKLNKSISGDNKPVTFNNTFNIDGSENPESLVNNFIKTLDREMKMRAV